MTIQKDNDIVKRLNKTKEEKKPDLRAEKEERDRKERQEEKKKQQEQVLHAVEPPLTSAKIVHTKRFNYYY